MKKLIAVLTLFLAFAFNANAQENKKMDALNAAKLDAVKMSESLNLTAEQQDQFISLFVMKHQTMNDPAATAEKKKEVTKIMDAKIRATLTAEQIQKLDANPALLATLTGTDKLPAPKK
jgi:hypothetical protein